MRGGGAYGVGRNRHRPSASKAGTMKELQKRKNIRLDGHNYSDAGAYFITICVKDGHEILWDGEPFVGAASCRPRLSTAGEVVENEIAELSHIYDGVIVTNYVIMPNHIHMIVRISENGRQNAAPTLSRIIGQWKRTISMKLTYSIWQKSFHDHIIRDENDYKKIAEYIENNPQKWTEDCFNVGAATCRPL